MSYATGHRPRRPGMGAAPSYHKNRYFGLTPAQAQAHGATAYEAISGGSEYIVEDGKGGSITAGSESQAQVDVLEMQNPGRTIADYANAGVTISFEDYRRLAQAGQLPPMPVLAPPPPIPDGLPGPVPGTYNPIPIQRALPPVPPPVIPAAPAAPAPSSYSNSLPDPFSLDSANVVLQDVATGEQIGTYYTGIPLPGSPAAAAQIAQAAATPALALALSPGWSAEVSADLSAGQYSAALTALPWYIWLAAGGAAWFYLRKGRR